MAEKHRATYQDVLDAPEHQIAELIDGELYLSPLPRPMQASVLTQLSAALIPVYSFLEPGWIVLNKPELHIGTAVVVPDIAAWRRTRMAKVPSGVAFTTVPDWVCEIASPPTRALDRIMKMPLYAREGVAHFWWIQPEDRTIEVMRAVRGKWIIDGVFAGAQAMQQPPFDEVPLDLSKLWNDLPSLDPRIPR